MTLRVQLGFRDYRGLNVHYSAVMYEWRVSRPEHQILTPFAPAICHSSKGGRVKVRLTEVKAVFMARRSVFT